VPAARLCVYLMCVWGWAGSLFCFSFLKFAYGVSAARDARRGAPRGSGNPDTSPAVLCEATIDGLQNPRGVRRRLHHRGFPWCMVSPIA
jgi:hypothetical protein